MAAAVLTSSQSTPAFGFLDQGHTVLSLGTSLPLLAASTTTSLAAAPVSSKPTCFQTHKFSQSFAGLPHHVFSEIFVTPATTTPNLRRTTSLLAIPHNRRPPSPVTVIPIPPTRSLRHVLQVDDGNKRQHRQPWVVGHRGALYAELENTRPGFLKCAEWGCDAVELDVWYLPRDGSLVVFHGGGTDEHPGLLVDHCIHQTDSASILDLTLEEVRALQFNTKFREFPCGEDKIATGSIPTLEQVLLDLKNTGTNVKIELKGPGTVEPTLALVERLDMVHQCQFSSFNHDLLNLLRQLRPQTDRQTGQYVYRTGALFTRDLPDDYLQQAIAIGASEVHLPYDRCTVERVTAIRAAGMSSMAWMRGPVGMIEDTHDLFWDIGNEDKSCYQALVDTGVDQVCCNRPDVLLSLLKERQVNAVMA